MIGWCCRAEAHPSFVAKQHPPRSGSNRALAPDCSLREAGGAPPRSAGPPRSGKRGDVAQRGGNPVRFASPVADSPLANAPRLGGSGAGIPKPGPLDNRTKGRKDNRSRPGCLRRAGRSDRAAPIPFGGRGDLIARPPSLSARGARPFVLVSCCPFVDRPRRGEAAPVRGRKRPGEISAAARYTEA